MFRQRLRISFTKEGPLRFISHHDLMRLFERALRRTGLPLRYSEGFNPRPQLSFPAALALGIQSQDELFEVELTRWVSPDGAREKVEREVPEGIGIRCVKSVGYGEKAEVVGTRFSIRMRQAPEDLDARLALFMNAEEAFVERKRKSGVKRINVREFVRCAKIERDSLVFDLTTSPAGSARPEEVIQAVLGDCFEACNPLGITRIRLDLAPPR